MGKIRLSYNKHGNKKVIVGGQSFDSKREYSTWTCLCSLQSSGKISSLNRQVPFVLVPGVRLYGEKRAKPAITYRADFTYMENGVLIVADAKSPHLRKDPVYRIKKHLMKYVHGIDIVEM